MNYKAVIFDLDGTLINTLQDIAESVNQALRKLSLPTHSVDSYRLKVGQGSRTMISRSLSGEHQGLVDKVAQMQRAYYGDHLHDQTRRYPGIDAMLAQLKQQGLKLAVLSNKLDEHTKRLINHFFQRDLFTVVQGHREGTALKPDPQSALAVAKGLNASPAETVFLGDSATDMQTAVNAGMFAVGAAWGFRDRAELLDNGAQVLIDRPNQLPKLLISSQKLG